MKAVRKVQQTPMGEGEQDPHKQNLLPHNNKQDQTRVLQKKTPWPHVLMNCKSAGNEPVQGEADRPAAAVHFQWHVAAHSKVSVVAPEPQRWESTDVEWAAKIYLTLWPLFPFLLQLSCTAQAWLVCEPAHMLCFPLLAVMAGLFSSLRAGKINFTNVLKRF